MTLGAKGSRSGGSLSWACATRVGCLSSAGAAALVAALGGGMSAHAESASPEPSGVTPASSQPRFALYGQATYTEQETSGFRAPYSGANSLSPGAASETVDATLYLGARLWRGAEFWVNPEADQGFGLDDTLGLAGFSSGEAYKVGKNAPYFRLQRAFIRQTLNFSGETSTAEAGPNQFAEEFELGIPPCAAVSV